MATLFRRAAVDPRVVPSQLVAVDPAHPSAASLCACYLPGAGSADLAGRNGAMGFQSGGGCTRVASAVGPAVSLDGSGWLSATTPALNFTTSDFTLSILVRFNDLSNSPVIIWHGNYQTQGYYAQLGSTGTVNFTTNQSGANQGNSTAASAVTVNTFNWLTFTRTGSVVRLYVNGADLTSTSNPVSNPADSSGTALELGHYEGGNGFGAPETIGAFFAWSRALPASEVARLYAEPFAMLRPVARRLYVAQPSTAISGALAGQAAANASASGTLAGKGALAGTAASVATSTASLAGTGTLAGSAAAAGSASASLSGQGALNGNAAASTNASATLSAYGAITGTASASSVASGTLAGQGMLSGTAASVATSTASLAGTGALAGSANASTAASGVLAASSSAPSLVGKAAANASASGSLAGTGAMQATASAQAASTATLSGSGALAGTAASTSSASGTLGNQTAFTGTANAVSTASGTLAGRGAVAGVASALTAAQGNLAGLGALTGSSLVQTAASGVLAGLGAMSGVVTAAANASASLAGQGSLAGAAQAQTQAQGTLAALNFGLAGQAAASSFAQGTLSGRGALSGTVSIVSGGSMLWRPRFTPSAARTVKGPAGSSRAVKGTGSSRSL